MDARTRLAVACLSAVGLLAALCVPARYGATLAAQRPLRPQATATQAPPAAGTSYCTTFVTATLSSHSIRLCDEAEVVVSTWPSCPMCPGGIHVVYVQVDVAFEAAWMDKESVASLRQLQNMGRGQEIRVGVIHYNNQSVRRVVPMTENLSKAYGALNGPQQGHDPLGDVIGAARMALNMLQDSRKEHERAGGSPTDKPCELVIFFASTSSAYIEQEAKIREAGEMITRNGTVLMAGCPETNVRDSCRATKDMPDPPQYYTEAPNGGGRMQRFMGDELDKLLSKSGLSSLSIWQSLPAGLQYIEGSASEPPQLTVQPDNSVTLGWDWTRLSRTEPHTVTYRVRPLSEGSWPIGGKVTLKDRENQVRELPLPVATLTVAGDCRVATPTAIPPTLTPVPVDTATPTAQPTRSPQPLCLPLVWKDD
jgi:hypothetical protein